MENHGFHKLVTQAVFTLTVLDIIIHTLPMMVYTSSIRHAPPTLHSFRYFTLAQYTVQISALLSIGCMRRGPKLRFEPMKLSTGFGLNKQKISDGDNGENSSMSLEESGASLPGSKGKSEANVFDRDECSILGFVFFVYVSVVARTPLSSSSMK